MTNLPTTTAGQWLTVMVGAVLATVTGIIVNQVIRRWRRRDEAEQVELRHLHELLERGETIAFETLENLPLSADRFKALELPRFESDCTALADRIPEMRAPLLRLAVLAGHLLRTAVSRPRDAPSHLVVRQALAARNLSNGLAATRNLMRSTGHR
jgi:hypothetical protein